MSNRAQCQYLRIFDSSTTYVRWQTYYVNQIVTLDSASWAYMPFSASGITESGASGGKSVSITAPATNSVVEAFTLALSLGRFCELKIYEFDSRLDNTAPQAGQTAAEIWTSSPHSSQTFTGASPLPSLPFFGGWTLVIGPCDSTTPAKSSTRQ